jgi:cysteine desulfurase
MEKGKIIYLDNAANSQVYDSVAEEVKRCMKIYYANPGALHKMGEEALKAVNSARKKVAEVINAKPEDIVFTSGATESNNLAIHGLARANPKRKKILISTIEHDSVFEVCKFLKTLGFKIVEIPVDKEGILNLEILEKEVDGETLLVSVIHGSNEIGVLQDIRKIGEICKKKGVYFHTDASQSFGREEIDVKKMDIDLLSASAQKIGGPEGVGMLFFKGEVKIAPIIFGGGQERGLRSGTENVPGIAGFGKAIEELKKENPDKIKNLRDKLMLGLEKIGGKINGAREKRLVSNVNVSFPGVEGDTLVMFLSERGIMCSTGSACSEKKKKESRILRALGLKENEIKGSVRFSLSENISEKDIDVVLKEIENAIKTISIR